MLGRFAPGIRRADGPGPVTGDIDKIIPPFYEHENRIESLDAFSRRMSLWDIVWHMACNLYLQEGRFGHT